MMIQQFFWAICAFIFTAVLASAQKPINRRQLLADCADPNSIYNAMIVFGIDGTYDGTTADILVPITADHASSDRNTLELRTKAYDFYETNYGLVFDPTIDSAQTIMNGAITVIPLAYNEDVPYRIHAFDDQTYSTPFQNRMQITNAFFDEVNYMVITNSDVNLSTTAYGVSNLMAGDLLVYGTLRVVIDGVYDENVMPEIQYNSRFGEKLAFGAPGTNNINSVDVHHPWFGSGRAFGAYFHDNNDDGTFTSLARYVMTFPSRFADASTDGTGCQDLMVDADDDEEDSGSDSDDAIFGALADTASGDLDEATAAYADRSVTSVAVSLSKSSWEIVWAIFGAFCVMNIVLCVWLRKTIQSKEVDQHFVD